MFETIQLENEIYFNFDVSEFVPSQYVTFSQNEEDVEQINLAALAEKSKAFDFLNDPAEDIYNLNDGKPI